MGNDKVETRQKQGERPRDREEESERAGERVEQLEHVPGNRMMMIQYFPVRGYSVHSLPQSHLSLSPPRAFFSFHAEIHLHPLTRDV